MKILIKLCLRGTQTVHAVKVKGQGQMSNII